MYLREYLEKNEHHCVSKKGVSFLREVKVKKCIFSCDECGIEFERKSGSISNLRKNNNYKHFCDNCKNPAIYAKLGHEKIKENLEKRIGERQIDSSGYIRVRVGRDHLGSGFYGGAVREHILIMEQHLGRKLNSGEVVHHIDGNKQNNNIENLDLCTVKEHNKCHATSEEIIFELYKQGIVGYNKVTKRYFLNRI